MNIVKCYVRAKRSLLFPPAKFYKFLRPALVHMFYFPTQMTSVRIATRNSALASHALDYLRILLRGGRKVMNCYSFLFQVTVQASDDL